MSDPLRISEVRFTPAPGTDSAAGLLGHITLVLNGALRIDGIALRLTREGRRTLAFPARRDSRGQSHAIVQPISTDVQLGLESQIFDLLDLRALDPGRETP